VNFNAGRGLKVRIGIATYVTTALEDHHMRTCISCRPLSNREAKEA